MRAYKSESVIMANLCHTFNNQQFNFSTLLDDVKYLHNPIECLAAELMGTAQSLATLVNKHNRQCYNINMLKTKQKRY